MPQMGSRIETCHREPPAKTNCPNRCLGKTLGNCEATDSLHKKKLLIFGLYNFSLQDEGRQGPKEKW
jgi:hypothetical protein